MKTDTKFWDERSVAEEEKSNVKVIHPHCDLLKCCIKKQASAKHTQDVQVKNFSILTSGNQ